MIHTVRRWSRNSQLQKLRAVKKKKTVLDVVVVPVIKGKMNKLSTLKNRQPSLFWIPGLFFYIQKPTYKLLLDPRSVFLHTETNVQIAFGSTVCFSAHRNQDTNAPEEANVIQSGPHVFVYLFLRFLMSQERQSENRDHEILQAALACGTRRRRKRGDGCDGKESANSAADSVADSVSFWGSEGGVIPAGEAVLEELGLRQEQVMRRIWEGKKKTNRVCFFRDEKNPTKSTASILITL